MAGLLGVVGTYLGALLAVTVVFVALGTGGGEPVSAALVDGATFGTVVWVGAVIYTAPIAIPVGCVSTVTYERARTMG